jgi:CheY-like chemotaxis protein
MGDEHVPTVLVVDDHADTRRVVRWMVERWGYRVLEAADGRQAFEVAAESRPALILMDLTMPRADGFDAIRSIRADADLAPTPIIAVTAYDKAAARDGAEAAGFDHYLSKPIDFYRLEVLLQKLIRKGRRDEPAPAAP